VTFIIEPELREWLREKDHTVIAVEIDSSSRCDFEVQEFHIRAVTKKHAAAMEKQKGMHRRQAEDGTEILLPNYRLEYEQEVRFGLKKVLCFHIITQTGIAF